QIWKKALTNTQFNAESRASREACDGGDSNCNGQVDEGFTKAAGACDGADADVCKQGMGQICHLFGGQSYCQGDGAVDTFRMNATSLGWQAPSDNGPGSPFLLYGATVAAGKHDGALVFDGTGYARQEADATNGKDRDLIAFYAFWARFDGDGNMALLSNSSKDGTSRLFVGRRNGVLHATAMGTEKSFAGISLPNSAWTHIGVDVTTNSVTIYVNGVQAGSVASAQAIVGSWERPFMLSGHWDGTTVTQKFRGALDEYQHYSSHPGVDRLASLVTLGEACNNTDDDCDGTVDEGFEKKGQFCQDPNSCVVSGFYACNPELTLLSCNGPLKPAGSTCSDGIACTKTDQCDNAGVCTGTTYSCDDALTCTNGTCNGDGTCTQTPTAGNCAVGGACYSSGQTAPGAQCMECAPALSQSAFSAKSTGSACTDGDVCTVSDACNAGACAGTAQVCDDGKECTVDTCQPGTGCVFAGAVADGNVCSDGNPCTAASVCAGGNCQTGAPKDCNDNNLCTFDGCNVSSGCYHQNIPVTQSCYSGAAGTQGVGVCVTGKEVCAAGVLGVCTGQVIPTPEKCNDLDDDCDGNVDEDYVNKGAACDGPDPDDCKNGVLECDLGGGLVCVGDLKQPELCDGKDNDCDGEIDEDFPNLGQSCDSSGDSDLCKEGIVACSGGQAVCGQDGPALMILADDVGDTVYTAQDSSGHAQDAQLKGFIAFTSGQRGNALLFDGVDDHVEVPASAKLTLGKKFTIATSFYWTGTGSVSLLESKTGACSDFALRINPSGAAYALVEQSQCSLTSVVTGVQISKNAWHHLALTADGTTFRMYVDGLLKGSKAQSAAPLETSTLYFGKKMPGVTGSFAGRMEEMGLWHYPLSATEITALSTSGVPAINRNLEICDSVDNDCDTFVDENKSAEICDGKDNDCDSKVDEDFADKGNNCDDPDDDACTKGVYRCNAAGDAAFCTGDGPLLLWRFENGSGSTAYDSAGLGHGNIVGGNWSTGASGNGMALTAAATVSVSGYTGLNLPTTASMTLEAQVKLSSISAGTIIQRANDFSLTLDSQGRPVCQVNGVGIGGSNATVTSSSPLSTNTWHHLACLYDSQALRLYSDAVLVGMVAGASGVVSNTGSTLVVGGFTGSVDTVAVWDVALSESEVALHKSSGIAADFTTRDICDGSDNDCDGSTDETYPNLGTKCDLDGDGCKNGDNACSAAGQMVCINDVPTNGLELCNGIDDNCDGQIDESFTDKGKACDGADADQCTNGTWACATDGSGLVCNGDTTIPETCNGLDDDCDGSVDEDFNIGEACDGGDPDQCKGGIFVCNANGNGALCSGDGPLALYQLEEGQNSTAANSSGLAGAGSLEDGPDWVVGHTGSDKALSFSDKKAAVNVASHDSLKIGAPLTLAA
ncbi:MAG TPA: hypothetical protein EYN66_08825, partial [Myxococcales bacterium]|nr:hypothetical protein [Myxococcales bacterium]